MIAVTSYPKARWTVLLAAVLGVTAAVLATPSVAMAAPSVAAAVPAVSTGVPPQMVQFSEDGLHWSNSYNQQLFQGIALVPGGSALRSFYVRNIASEAALLRVTLANVGTTSIPLASALSVSTSTTGAPGATIPVSLAQPCYTLSQGLRLASGDSIRLDNTVSLGDLSGSAGQDASVWFAIRVSLSSTDVAAPAPDTCPVDYGTVDTFPNPTVPGTTTASTSKTPLTVYHRTATGWTVGTSVGGTRVTIPTNPTVPACLSVTGNTSVRGATVTAPGCPRTPIVPALVSNTARFYQEYDVAFWLAMSVLGMIILILVRRRRADQQPETLEYDRQIGSSR